MKTNKLLLAAALGAASLIGATTASACSLGQWSSTSGTPVANQPDQTPSVARYSGLCAMQADAIGDFVTDTTPADEASYRVRFYIFTGTHSGGTADVFQARNSGGTNIIRVTYDGTNLGFGMNGTGTTRTAAVEANRWYSVELAWEASATGSLNITVVGGNADAPVAVSPITGVNNSSDRIADARLGKIAGSGTGFINFDAFDSRRTTSPGRLCPGDANADGQYGSADRVRMTNEILGTSLANGQPDLNNDGFISSPDRVRVTNLILAGATCN